MFLGLLNFSLGKMSDDESDKVTNKLTSREEFTGWRNKVMLMCMSKGDTDGMYGDLGADPNMGYRSYQAGAQGNNRRDEWNKRAQKLVGKVGNTITNSSLRRVWTVELLRAASAGSANGTRTRSRRRRGGTCTTR